MDENPGNIDRTPPAMNYANIYRRTFTATHPTSGEPIEFVWEIRTDEVINIERILEQTDDVGQAFPEDMADRLFAAFGGFQFLQMEYRGVVVEAIREPAFE